MSYEIKEEGYEYKGFKLGQMTNKGKIIGFDIYGCDNFIAINNNISEYDYNISESDYVDIILKDFENYSFSWFNPNKLELIEELPPISKTQLNVIQQIRNVIDNATVKVEFFSEEFCISLYDSEIPICWDKQNGLYILTETMSGNIDHEMTIEILSVMDIIRDNLEWFKECMQND